MYNTCIQNGLLCDILSEINAKCSNIFCICYVHMYQIVPLWNSPVSHIVPFQGHLM